MSFISKILLISCVIQLHSLAIFGFGEIQTGQATYYNNRFFGVKTTSGERYNPYLFTAAHRYFPLGSYLEVIFPKTNKSTIVRVNDRGPYRRGTIIDVSLCAAQEIGLVSYGIAKVSVRLIPEMEITDSLRSSWLKRDTLLASLHPFVAKKVIKKKMRRGRKKARVK